LIAIALGSRPLGDCPRGVGNVGRITVDDLLAAIDAALNGCPRIPPHRPRPTPTPPRAPRIERLTSPNSTKEITGKALRRRAELMKDSFFWNFRNSFMRGF